jgi:hypothetical protein
MKKYLFLILSLSLIIIYYLFSISNFIKTNALEQNIDQDNIDDVLRFYEMIFLSIMLKIIGVIIIVIYIILGYMIIIKYKILKNEKLIIV